MTDNTEYTPTTNVVRAIYADSRDRDYYSPSIEKARQYRESGGGKGEFDRWLAEVKREVAAQAWDEGYEAGFGDAAFEARGLRSDPDAHEYPHDNPYRSGSEGNNT